MIIQDPNSPVGKTIPLIPTDISRLRKGAPDNFVADKAYNLDPQFRSLADHYFKPEINAQLDDDTRQKLPTMLLNMHYFGKPVMQESDDLTAEVAKPAPKGIFSRIASDASQAIQSGAGQFQEALQRQGKGKQGLLDTTATLVGETGFAAGKITSSVLGNALSALTPDAIEEPVKRKAVEAFQWLANTEYGKGVAENIATLAEQYNQLKETDPVAAERIDSALGIGTLALTLTGTEKTITGARKMAGAAGDKLDDFLSANMQAQKNALSKVAATKAPTEAAKILATAQNTAPDIGFREKMAGVRPDIKKRIAGKKDKLQEYFEVAHARNLDDTLPTPLEYGARSVETARNKLQKVMDDTGGKIGQFRKKIATVKVGIDDMNNIEKTFDQSLRGLNLEIRNGGIARAAGKVAGKVSDSEVKTLQGIYDDILRVKAAPSSENLIDLRNAIQDKINFAKTAKEASNVIDPVSRKVRSTIRDVNLKMIGKSQGKLLDDYSDLAEALKEMNTFVESKTGGEFLLKRVLSERGRVPREIMSKVQEYTGIDLMDDATMAQLAVEIIGNPAQKGLFRQEITKAGLDAMDVIDLISGAPGGTIRATKALMQPAKNLIAPIEETFLKAAR